MAPDELTVFGKFYLLCFGGFFLYVLHSILRGWYLMFKSFSLLKELTAKQGTSLHDTFASGRSPFQQSSEFSTHRATIRQSNRKFLVTFLIGFGILAAFMILDFTGIVKIIER